MPPHIPLSPKAQEELLHHCYQEGERAYQQQQYLLASIWFSQCLSLVQAVPDQVNWLGTLLFNLGRLLVYRGDAEQAVGFLEASAYVQMAQPQGEMEANVAQAVGMFLDSIGYPAQAQYFLERAQATYQACALPAKVEATQQEVQRVAARARSQGQHPIIARFHHFEIRIGQQVARRLTVGAEGKIAWSAGDALDHPPALGMSIPWNVVCTTSLIQQPTAAPSQAAKGESAPAHALSTRAPAVPPAVWLWVPLYVLLGGLVSRVVGGLIGALLRGELGQAEGALMGTVAGAIIVGAAGVNMVRASIQKNHSFPHYVAGVLVMVFIAGIPLGLVAGAIGALLGGLLPWWCLALVLMVFPLGALFPQKKASSS